jgi:hypothetical protein
VSVATFVVPFRYGSGSGSGTVINYGSSSGSTFLAHYSSGSASQKVTVPTVPVPQRCLKYQLLLVESIPSLLKSLKMLCWNGG